MLLSFIFSIFSISNQLVVCKPREELTGTVLCQPHSLSACFFLRRSSPVIMMLSHPLLRYVLAASVVFIVVVITLANRSSSSSRVRSILSTSSYSYNNRDVLDDIGNTTLGVSTAKAPRNPSIAYIPIPRGSFKNSWSLPCPRERINVMECCLAPRYPIFMLSLSMEYVETTYRKRPIHLALPVNRLP